MPFSEDAIPVNLIPRGIILTTLQQNMKWPMRKRIFSVEKFSALLFIWIVCHLLVLLVRIDNTGYQDQ
jgi:hypothetical protein